MVDVRKRVEKGAGRRQDRDVGTWSREGEIGREKKCVRRGEERTEFERLREREEDRDKQRQRQLKTETMTEMTERERKSVCIYMSVSRKNLAFFQNFQFKVFVCLLLLGVVFFFFFVVLFFVWGEEKGGGGTFCKV